MLADTARRFRPKRPDLPLARNAVLSVAYLRSVSRGFPGMVRNRPFSRISALWAGFGMLVNYDCKTATLLPDDVQALG